MNTQDWKRDMTIEDRIKVCHHILTKLTSKLHNFSPLLPSFPHRIDIVLTFAFPLFLQMYMRPDWTVKLSRTVPLCSRRAHFKPPTAVRII